MGWLLYQVGMLVLLTGAAPVLLLRRGRHYLPTLRGRLGLNPAVAPASRLWMHAVSVGEVGVAATLIRALPASTPLVLTTVTPTGQAVARRSIAADRVAYLPFDLGFAVRRFLDAYTPSALVLVEGDLWPLLLARVKQRSLPVVVVNGRVSDRGFARLRRLKRWVRPILQPVDLFGVQTQSDRDRLLELGVAADRVRVTGNLKFESPEPPKLDALEAAVRAVAAGRPILVAGSTMAGEEEAVLDAFGAVGPERALLVLAPRHPERAALVLDLIAARRWSATRRSHLDAPDERDAGERMDVLLLDTMGELASLYRHAASVFIGGTLVPSGGHNPLEAARFGAPIAAGPSMQNFAEMAALFDARSAWRRVAHARDLGAAWTAWLDDPTSGRIVGERAAALVVENRGALERTLELLRPLLAGPAR
ncbi:MAG TPA: 3-deoxy-D-manno-octulosonic acid transferase [Thermoanaerobaculia bacterium]|nr:3-deoxy-D-manno-octulosonic acid transferase [Thermoanaerobaculia bacterium]